jgi:RNA polymerase sigma-70 factor (ECF subfamily)
LRRVLGERYRRQLGDSEDATQDALIAAFQSLPRYEHQGGGSFLAWLLCIAEREALQKLRKDAAQKRGGTNTGQHLESLDGVEPGASDTTPSQVAAGRELEERVRAAVEALPGSEREVILLKRYLGLDTRAIQEQLGLPSQGAVRALLSRAQTRLAEQLSEE